MRVELLLARAIAQGPPCRDKAQRRRRRRGSALPDACRGQAAAASHWGEGAAAVPATQRCPAGAPPCGPPALQGSVRLRPAPKAPARASALRFDNQLRPRFRLLFDSAAAGFYRGLTARRSQTRPRARATGAAVTPDPARPSPRRGGGATAAAAAAAAKCWSAAADTAAAEAGWPPAASEGALAQPPPPPPPLPLPLPPPPARAEAARSALNNAASGFAAANGGGGRAYSVGGWPDRTWSVGGGWSRRPSPRHSQGGGGGGGGAAVELRAQLGHILDDLMAPPPPPPPPPQ